MVCLFEILVVVGIKVVIGIIENGVMVIVDGIDGDVIIDFFSEMLKKYEEKYSVYLV